MPTDESLYDFVGRIVQSQFPEEMDAYNLEGQSIINELVQSGRIRQSEATDTSEFAFIPEAVNALSFIGVLWSVYEIFGKVRSEFSSKGKLEQIERIAEEWRKTLEIAGIEEEKAIKIVQIFSTELKRLK